MKNVRILECTLRDGGRVINCEFPDDEIKNITRRLSDAKLDIIEVGFLRDSQSVSYKGNSTFFTDVDQIIPFLHKNDHTMYVAFIDFGMFDFETLKPYDGTSIDGIRFGFTQKNYKEKRQEILDCARIVKEKGYKLFIQGVNSISYSDKELLEVVDLINEIHPYSFGMVDTYGAMYQEDVDRIYGLIDNNLEKDICIDFHSHNNYQLSFAFAMEVIRLSKGVREIIIDSTLLGMGKVAGNLNTELIVDYLVRKMHYDYDFEEIMDIIDDYIYPYANNYKWGYSLPAMMAGIYKSHPNNIIYLTEKFRLQTKDIKVLLSMIDPLKRQRYDYDNIQRLYAEYVNVKIDDRQAIIDLKTIFEGKEVFIMAPGNSLNTHREEIDNYIKEKNPVTISINFIADYDKAYAFFGNQKRYDLLEGKRKGRNVIISSNVHSNSDKDIIVNYDSLINRGYVYFENSTIMLLKLLIKLNPCKIIIAGLDGFNPDIVANYSDSSFQNERHVAHFSTLNREIGKMLSEIVDTFEPNCKVQFMTPSIYLEEMKRVSGKTIEKFDHSDWL